jgi:cytochrome c553
VSLKVRKARFLVPSFVVVMTAILGWRLSAAQEDDSSFIPPSTSIYQLMIALVDHSAHRLWEAGYEDVITGREWQTLERYAIQLVESGTLISLGGSGVADAGRALAPAWQAYAQEMTDAALAALAAVEAQDQDALMNADVAILRACEACHDAFKPETPSEGISHIPHYPPP